MPDRIAHTVATRYLAAPSAATADAVVSQIESQLGGIFRKWGFSVYTENSLGMSSVAIQFFQAPPNSPSTVQWNAPKYVKVSISAGNKWLSGESAPDTVTAETMRSKGIRRMRKKTGPLDKVVKTVVTWFKANEKELTGND